jgi:hypothetical protein
MMEVLDMVERKDGGADLKLDLTEEERLFLIEYGFNALLRTSLNNFNAQFNKGTKNVKSTNKSK